jgi:hypothetical protein
MSFIKGKPLNNTQRNLKVPIFLSLKFFQEGILAWRSDQVMVFFKRRLLWAEV